MRTDGSASYTVRDNPAQSRFELETSAGLATVEYHHEGHILILFYTEVPPFLRCNGIGKILVRDALGEIRWKQNIDPRCSFVRAFAFAELPTKYRDPAKATIERSSSAPSFFEA